MITPGQALWIINNLPQTPTDGVMPSDWQKSRHEVIHALQAIIDEPEHVCGWCQGKQELSWTCPTCNIF